MKLTNMEMTKAEKKESSPVAMSDYNGPDFPYGLKLCLDNASLEKLGFDALPKVGAKMMVHAMGVVVEVSQHESKNHESRRVEIQIQRLGVEDEDESDELEAIVKRRAKSG